MVELRPIIVFHATILFAILEFIIRFVSNSYRLCPVLFRGIKKKRRLYLKPFSWGEMQCVAFRLKTKLK